jgi:outer membrane immunogenic protein
LEYQESDDSDFDRSPNFDGFVGGIFLGYNYQDNNVVYGVEADAGLGDLSEGPDKNSSNNDWSSFDIDWNAHVRARAGLVYDATLFYVTGGLAIAGVSVDDNDPGWSDDNATHVGWTVGCGIDRLLTENLTVRFEYLYDDYGSEEYSFNGSFNYKGDVDLTSHTTRIGLSYTF